jgi:hypothetical protein
MASSSDIDTVRQQLNFVEERLKDAKLLVGVEPSNDLLAYAIEHVSRKMPDVQSRMIRRRLTEEELFSIVDELREMQTALDTALQPLIDEYAPRLEQQVQRMLELREQRATSREVDPTLRLIRDLIDRLRYAGYFGKRDGDSYLMYSIGLHAKDARSLMSKGLLSSKEFDAALRPFHGPPMNGESKEEVVELEHKPEPRSTFSAQLPSGRRTASMGIAPVSIGRRPCVACGTWTINNCKCKDRAICSQKCCDADSKKNPEHYKTCAADAASKQEVVQLQHKPEPKETLSTKLPFGRLAASVGVVPVSIGRRPCVACGTLTNNNCTCKQRAICSQACCDADFRKNPAHYEICTGDAASKGQLKD